VTRTFYPWLCEILISWFVLVGRIKEVFLFLTKSKTIYHEVMRALPSGVGNIDWRFKFLAEEKIRLNIAIKRSKSAGFISP
jgi:hypothetical protein